MRERAAMALARRKGDIVPQLVGMLTEPGDGVDAAVLAARYGACQALARLGGAAAPAVPALHARTDPCSRADSDRSPIA
ncbi:MAG: hypothetical protein JNK15_01490 [Planctomycetes bacterium]|nr:hypothetical protein [Planctomycetota bacterium]